MKEVSIICLFVVGALTGCKQQYTEVSERDSPVKLAKVQVLEPSLDPLPIYGSGRVASSESYQLSFKTGGIIARIAVEAGQQVRKGQVLAQLDLDEISAQVVQAEANASKARRDLDRFRRLYADSAATLQSVQDLETGLEVSQSAVRVARFNRKYSTITAPAHGVILQKLAESNELVSTGQPILVLGAKDATNAMTMRLGLADKDVVKLQLGDSASIQFDAYPGDPGRAIITEIAAEGHPRTGTFEVELAIQNYPRPLKNGFFAKAVIYPGNQEPYFRIPMHAMIEGQQDEAIILIPKEQAAYRQVVTPAYIGQDFFAVSQAQIKQQQFQVITDGASYLREGETFQPVVN